MNNKRNREYIWPSLKAYTSLLWQNHPWLTILTLTNTLGSIAISVLVPYFISLAIADVIMGHDDQFWSHIIFLSTAAVIGVLGNAVGFKTGMRLAARIQRLATNKAFSHLLYRGASFHASNPGGKLVSNALEYGSSAVRVLFDLIHLGLLPYVLTSVIGIGIVFFHSVEIGIGLVIVYTTITTLTILDSKRRSTNRAVRKLTQDAATANIADVITNAVTTKAFAREADEEATNDTLQLKLQEYRFRDWGASANAGTIRMGVLLLLQVLFIIYIAGQVKADPAYLGIGIYAFTYTLGMLSKLFELGTLLRTGEEALLSASTMTRFMMDPPEVTDSVNAKQLSVRNGTVNFQEVSFAYPDQKDHLVFSNLNLVIPAGQKVGLIGRSGGGKTSLTRLLLRFEDLESGRILVDDMDIKQVTQKSLRQAIGYVPQDPMLFHRTIRENIAYGRPEATDEEILDSAKKAFAYDFIMSLPDGLNTIVGERGVKLSGGQRQRIAIARVVLKNAPILVLDEATSALDSESELYIQKALSSLMKDRTSLVVAHRLSTIARLDRIIVLDEGRIIEDGSHDELVAQKGVYAKLWSHQSDGFIE